MSYRITHAYCWYNEGSMIVKMYLINEMPFTFDELPSECYTDPHFMRLADQYRTYEPEDLYKNSFYLIDEEAHPCLFLMDIENPEDMPQDEYYEFNEEDLTS